MQSQKLLLAYAGTSTINGHFYTVAKSLLPNSTSLLDTAALFARLGAAQFDSNVVGWYIKYNTLFWRPITAIRCASRILQLHHVEVCSGRMALALETVPK